MILRGEGGARWASDFEGGGYEVEMFDLAVTICRGLGIW